MNTLWLASGSPRRAELLRQVGSPFSRLPAPGIDERPRSGESPQDYVWRMAMEKARAGWRTLAPDQLAGAVVLGADTSVVLDGEILGKPATHEQARDMLSRLNGNEHQVISAVSLVWEAHQETRLSTTRVRFRQLAASELARYAATGEGRDKAGAYGIQGMGALLVESIHGSYSGVVGLPLEVLPELFERAQVAFWRSPDHSA